MRNFCRIFWKVKISIFNALQHFRDERTEIILTLAIEHF